MRNNDLVIFIDSKGVSHNALVKAFREHRDEQGVLVDSEPLVTLTYNLPTGEPKEVIDVHHMDHPAKQEPNPDLPTYALHVWKYEHEEHLEVPSDHPLHDHPYEIQKFDDGGNPVPKRRPKYEMHVHLHKLSKGLTRVPGGVIPLVEQPIAGQRSAVIDPDPVGPGVQQLAPVNHPAHPDTIHFAHKCVSCGIPVRRVASHQGGTEWDIQVVEGQPWKAHVCKPEDIEAFRESLKPKKEPELSELQKAALEPAGDPPKPSRGQFLIGVIGTFTEGSHLKVSLAALQAIAETGEMLRLVPITSPDIKSHHAVEVNKRIVYGDTTIPNDSDDVISFDPDVEKALDQEIAANIPEKEVDVITELQNAPPAPDEPQAQGQNEGEQAEG